MDNVYWCVSCVDGKACLWAFSSDGRAPASHAGGRGIDTLNVHALFRIVHSIRISFTDAVDVIDHQRATEVAFGRSLPLLAGWL